MQLSVYQMLIPRWALDMPSTHLRCKISNECLNALERLEMVWRNKYGSSGMVSI